MASFLNVNLPSDDEEDIDYIPDENVPDGDSPAKKKKRKRSRGVAAGAAPEDDEDEDAKGAETDVIPKHKQAEKKAKVDALWSQLQQQTKPAAAKATGGLSGLGALSRPVTKKGTSSGADQVLCRCARLGVACAFVWMRSLSC
jgi:hypothetical protein